MEVVSLKLWGYLHDWGAFNNIIGNQDPVIFSVTKDQYHISSWTPDALLDLKN